jgi:hypothetical protein
MSSQPFASREHARRLLLTRRVRGRKSRGDPPNHWASHPRARLARQNPARKFREQRCHSYRHRASRRLYRFPSFVDAPSTMHPSRRSSYEPSVLRSGNALSFHLRIHHFIPSRRPVAKYQVLWSACSAEAQLFGSNRVSCCGAQLRNRRSGDGGRLRFPKVGDHRNLHAPACR